MEMYHKVEKNGVSQILIDLTKFCNSDSSKEFPFPVKGTARISCNEIKNKYVLIIKQFRIDFIIILYLIINNLKTLYEFKLWKPKIERIDIFKFFNFYALAIC